MPDLHSDIEVLCEQETSCGWLYTVRVTRDGAEPADCQLRLHWSDHDYWTGGRVAPSSLVEEIVRILLDTCGPAPLPASFDASSARRWAPALDRLLADRFGSASAR
ncbi:MAG: hypothetical protein ACF8R7_06650 [Phycisphaerales bacterium JB039]